MGISSGAMPATSQAVQRAVAQLPQQGASSLPTTGTMIAPNGRTFNTNPAANAYMAQMAAQARQPQLAMQPSVGQMEFGGQSAANPSQAQIANEMAARNNLMQLSQIQNQTGRPATQAELQRYGQTAGFAQQPAGQMGFGGQPPSPQMLGEGLERQAAMQRAMGKGSQPPPPQMNQFGGYNQNYNQGYNQPRQMPMTMQRQPQLGGQRPQQNFDNRGGYASQGNFAPPQRGGYNMPPTDFRR